MSYFSKKIINFVKLKKVEPSLEEHSEEFSSIVVHRLSKIIYYIDKENIMIADFWDCRQARKTLATRIK